VWVGCMEGMLKDKGIKVGALSGGVIMPCFAYLVCL